MTPHEYRWVQLKYMIVAEYCRQLALIDGLRALHRY